MELRRTQYKDRTRTNRYFIDNKRVSREAYDEADNNGQNHNCFYTIEKRDYFVHCFSIN
jgi:hypothetical protein